MTDATADRTRPAATAGIGSLRSLPSLSSASDTSTDGDSDEPNMSYTRHLKGGGVDRGFHRQPWTLGLDCPTSYDDSCDDGSASVLSTHAGQGRQRPPHRLGAARSLSPRSSAILQTSLRSATSSPGGGPTRSPLHRADGGPRGRARSGQPDRLSRSEPSLPVTRSLTLEDDDGDSVPSSALVLLLRTPAAAPAPPSAPSVLDLRRDNSLLDRPTTAQADPPATTHAPRQQRYHVRHSPSSGSIISIGSSRSDGGGTARDRALRRRSVPAVAMSSSAAAAAAAAAMATTNHILLHVYDLLTPDTQMQLPFGCVLEIGQCFQGLNDGLHCLGTGAYHVGVEVNGTEYAYGACGTPGKSGVFPCAPRRSPGYRYRTTLDFGPRPAVRRSHLLVLEGDGRTGPVAAAELTDDLERLDAREILRALARDYRGTDYDILRRNCCTFARDLLLRFGVAEEEIPAWFSNLAESGALTQDLALATVAPLRAMSATCEPDAAAWREAYEVRIGGCC